MKLISIFTSKLTYSINYLVTPYVKKILASNPSLAYTLNAILSYIYLNIYKVAYFKSHVKRAIES